MNSDTTVDVAVIGAGFGGLCAAIRLREAGIHDFVVLEKAHDVGGTWRENTYPGAACDVMSLMYSFSFAPNPKWTRGYARQPEILDYLRDVADRYDLLRSIRFDTEIVSQVFDDDSDRWTLTSSDGTTTTARAVIDATGPLHIPNIPDLPGIATFEGSVFHSARWDHDIDLTGKRVAVIGTGASAVQFIPHLAERAAHLDVYQRTPAWVLPKPDRTITAPERLAYRTAPGLRKLVRAGIYLSHEALVGAFLHPRYMPAVRAVARAHLRRQVRNPQLRALLTPDYEVGCKRMIIDNRYYPTLQRDDVALITDPIVEITPTGIRTRDGGDRPADVIVYGTGFKATDAWREQSLVGRSGRAIQHLWRDGSQAYLGVAVHGLPNHFTVMGPNSGVGNQSIVFMIEAQTRYIVAVLGALLARRATRVEVKSHVQQHFNRELQRRSLGTVWTSGGCRSWYLDDHGVNRALWPGSTVSYWRRTRTPVLSDFEFTYAEDRDDDQYHGSATLIDADGTEVDVQAHLLAVYQPVDNQLHWAGRLEATAALTRIHQHTNQPVRLRITGNAPVDALLTDADPWGGTHIVGHGRPPFTREAASAFVTDDAAAPARS
ncbi:NAD(P)-binding domain-containing protein [Mycolicibacterium sp. 3033]|nr:NAD(P)-binding domain-containing protein [Mycolicibacterium aurantiacum]